MRDQYQWKEIALNDSEPVSFDTTMVGRGQGWGGVMGGGGWEEGCGEGGGQYTRNTLSELYTQDYNKLRAYFI